MAKRKVKTSKDEMPEDEKKAICRDFLRNCCSRGSSCKYKHPEGKLVFCIDFQRGKCTRAECAFLHKFRDEVDHCENNIYQGRPEEREIQVPVCKDFLKGECERPICKFRHVLGRMNVPTEQPQIVMVKRRRYDETPPQPAPCFAAPQWSLEEENAFLRKTVQDLRKRVDDLQATNEFLLDQNAQMRKPSTGLTAVTVPAAVTITNHGQVQQVSGPIRTVTASVATVPVSIAAVASGTPVSIATVSMSPVLTAPSVTMATAHHGESASLISTAQGQLVSYPLVARPVITNLTH